MRITKVDLENYRQYRKCQYDFPKSDHTDVHIIVGENVQGKTNLLNAINWCLYNEEPHLTNSSSSLAKPNINALHDPEVEDVVPVVVRLEVQDESKIYKFIRKAQYSKNPNKQGEYHEMFNKLTVQIGSLGSNWETIDQEDETADIVKSIFPYNMRELFFFDGEHLSGYFKSSASERIKNMITLTSQIQMLEVVEKRLNKVLEKKNGEASKNKGSLGDIERQINDLSKEIEINNDHVTELTSKLAIAKEEKERLDELLGRVEDIGSLESSRKEASQKLENLVSSRLDKERLLIQASPGYITLSYLKQSLTEFHRLIQEMQKKKQIPPRIDKHIIEQSIESMKCAICESTLDSKHLDVVQKLLDSISISSQFAKRLNDQSAQIQINLHDLEVKKQNIEVYLKDMVLYRSQEDDLRKQLDELDKKINSIPNIDDTRRYWEKRKQLESAIEETIKEIGAYESMLKKGIPRLEVLKADFDREVRRAGIAEALRQEIDLCKRLIKLTARAKTDLVNETREEARAKTQELFFRLNKTSENYRNVMLNTNYELDLLHKSGQSCIGSCSGAERALLALSYIIALHDLTNMDFPLFIDTPIATISGLNRTNFAEVLAQIGVFKQIILLFTSSEYSKELQNVYTSNHASIRRLVCISNESTLKEY